MRNENAVLKLRVWITSKGWQEESTFLVVCYLKGTRPLARYTDEQLQEIVNAAGDPDQIKSVVAKYGAESLFDELPFEEFMERLRHAEVEDGNTRLEAVIPLDFVKKIRCRCIDIYEGMSRTSSLYRLLYQPIFLQTSLRYHLCIA